MLVFYFTPNLYHRYKLAHTMNGIIYKPWCMTGPWYLFRDIVIEKKEKLDDRYDLIIFSVNVSEPRLDMYMSVKYDNLHDEYSEFCALDTKSQNQLDKLTYPMVCPTHLIEKVVPAT